jgi:hypothetical protein
MKLSKIGILFLMCLLVPIYAGNISLSFCTAPEYQANSISYAHSFNEEYAGAIYYSYDGIENGFSSLQLSLDKCFDENAYGRVSYGTDETQDYSQTKTIGLMYGITFRDSVAKEKPVSDTEELLTENAISVTEDIEPEELPVVVEATQFIVPRGSVGLNFSNTKFISENYSDTARGISLGAGLQVGSHIDLAVDWEGYSYSSDETLKTKSPRNVTRLSSFSLSSTSPRSSLGGTLTLIPLTDVLQVYYRVQRTLDVSGEIVRTTVVGVDLALLEFWRVGANKENISDGSEYSTVSVGFSF